ncbi:MAG: selenocysteine-specific translation elongation factor [Gemmatimonadota bacterium]
MKAFVLGTAGHVDHGKTTLVQALTGTDTDRWKEEKERGLTIDLGFARLDLGQAFEIGVIDVPGHEDFVKNMLAGATGLDLLLLVVAADEGPMPQTREHLAIAHLLGIEHGIVAFTRIDRAEPEWIDMAEEAVREELQTVLGHADWPILHVCAPTGQGLDELKAEILARANTITERDARDLVRLPVDRCFSIAGAGAVVTGTLWSGSVEVGDQAQVLPLGRPVRIRSAQVHGESRGRVEAGRRCALALVGVDASEVTRGATVVGGAPWPLVSRFGARVRVLSTTSRGLEHGQRVRLFLGTSEVMARAQLPGAEPLQPGDREWIVLQCEEPIVTRVRDRFILRFYSPVQTIGGGTVAEFDPPPTWRERTGEWRSVLEGSGAESVCAAVRLTAGAGVRRESLPLLTGLSASVIDALDAAELGGIIEIGGRLFDESSLIQLKRVVLTELERAHAADRRAAGISLEGLRTACIAPGEQIAPELLERALADLKQEEALHISGPLVRLPGHEPRLTDSERRQLSSLLEFVRAGGLQPPSLAEIDGLLGGDTTLRADLLRILLASQELVAVTPELYVSAEAEKRLVEQARAVLEAEGVASPAGFRSALGVSRKYLIPLLEYLDRSGITRRTSEGRVLAEKQGLAS